MQYETDKSRGIEASTVQGWNAPCATMKAIAKARTSRTGAARVMAAGFPFPMGGGGRGVRIPIGGKGGMSITIAADPRRHHAVLRHQSAGGVCSAAAAETSPTCQPPRRIRAQPRTQRPLAHRHSWACPALAARSRLSRPGRGRHEDVHLPRARPTRRTSGRGVFESIPARDMSIRSSCCSRTGTRHGLRSGHGGYGARSFARSIRRSTWTSTSMTS